MGGFLTLVSVLLFILKMIGTINVGWFIVFLPFIIEVILSILFIRRF